MRLQARYHLIHVNHGSGTKTNPFVCALTISRKRAPLAFVSVPCIAANPWIAPSSSPDMDVILMFVPPPKPVTACQSCAIGPYSIPLAGWTCPTVFVCALNRHV